MASQDLFKTFLGNIEPSSTKGTRRRPTRIWAISCGSTRLT